MKLYKIKLMGTDMYLKAVIFDTANDELKLVPVLAFFEEEEAIFEEDKAKKYCEELNKQEQEVQFVLEEVER